MQYKLSTCKNFNFCNSNKPIKPGVIVFTVQSCRLFLILFKSSRTIKQSNLCYQRRKICWDNSIPRLPNHINSKLCSVRSSPITRSVIYIVVWRRSITWITCTFNYNTYQATIVTQQETNPSIWLDSNSSVNQFGKRATNKNEQTHKKKTTLQLLP